MSFIRYVQMTDASAVLAIYEPIVRHTAISFELEPPTLAQMQERIAATAAEFPWLVADVDDGLAGYAYASRHRERPAYRWSVDVSVYVAPHARGRGVARALYAALLSILGDLCYFTACAGIALPNAASVAFHEAMGFQGVGVYRNVGYKLGAWHDVGWWQRALRPYTHEPPCPMAMSQYLTTRLGQCWALPDTPSN